MAPKRTRSAEQLISSATNRLVAVESALGDVSLMKARQEIDEHLKEFPEEAIRCRDMLQCGMMRGETERAKKRGKISDGVTRLRHLSQGFMLRALKKAYPEMDEAIWSELKKNDKLVFHKLVYFIAGALPNDGLGTREEEQLIDMIASANAKNGSPLDPFPGVDQNGLLPWSVWGVYRFVPIDGDKFMEVQHFGGCRAALPSSIAALKGVWTFEENFDLKNAYIVNAGGNVKIYMRDVFTAAMHKEFYSLRPPPPPSVLSLGDARTPPPALAEKPFVETSPSSGTESTAASVGRSEPAFTTPENKSTPVAISPEVPAGPAEGSGFD
eukprot:2458819-Amphidinium_carterae.1